MWHGRGSWQGEGSLNPSFPLQPIIAVTLLPSALLARTGFFFMIFDGLLFFFLNEPSDVLEAEKLQTIP